MRHLRGLSLLTGLGIVLLGGALRSDDAPQSDLAKGRASLRVGEYAAAIEHFKAAVAADTDVVEALRGQADALEATGRYEEGLELLEKHSSFASSAPLLTRAARIRLRVGELAPATELLRKAAELAPGSAEALYFLGETQRRQGDLEGAGATFDRAIDAYRFLDPDAAEKLPAEAFVYWGLTLVRMNRHKEAEDIMFSQAEEIDGKNALMLLERGRMYHDKYNFPDSRSFYRDAIDENPAFADALAAMADNYITDFQVGSRRFDLAEKFLERALEVNPRHSKAHTVRGRVWFYDGDFPRAVDDLKRAIEFDRANMQARGLLAASYHVMGNRAAYDEIEKETLAINPKAAEFYHTIATSIELKFRYPDTVAMCDRALELDPEYWPAFVTLGINCLRTGENIRGRELLERSWKNDKYNVWVYNTRKLLSHMDANFTSFETDRFVYFLPRREAPLLRPYLEPLLARAWESMAKRYKVEIDRPIQIESFSEHKWFSARTVGLEGFAASGACFGKLVTLTTPKALPQNWGAVAWHEFAHVVTIQLTDYRVPRWLTEGISVYEEGFDHPRWARNFRREIADAWGSGRLLPMAELDLGFSKPKFPMQILLSYYQGCLIVQYIERKWGFDAVLDILAGYKDYKNTARIFRDVLGQELEEFDRGFQEFVKGWVEANGYAPMVAEEMIPQLELRRDRTPEDPQALCDLAWAYFCNDNALDASLTAGKAAELDERSGDAQAILGMLRLREKKQNPAREHLLKARDLGTRFAFRVHAILGDLATGDKDHEAAVEHYEAAKKVSPIAGAASPPRGNLYYKLASAYDELGQADKAVEQLEALSEIAVEDPQCRYRVAQYALEHKDWERAYRALEGIMYIDPFQMPLHRHLAEAAEQLGRHDTVIRETLILLQDAETNKLKAHLALARAYLATEELEKARDAAREVLGLDEDNAEAEEILEKASR